MGVTETTYRLLDRDSGTFLRVGGGGFQEVFEVGGPNAVYETRDLSALYDIKLNWGDRHAGYRTPSSVDIEGEVDIVRTVTVWTSVGNERFASSQEVDIVDLAAPTLVDVRGTRPYATMPAVLRRHYVDDEIAASLSGRLPDDVTFMVVVGGTSVAEGDFVATGRRGGSCPVGKVALVQPLPDEWPAAEGMPSDAVLVLVDTSPTALEASITIRPAAAVTPARAL